MKLKVCCPSIVCKDQMPKGHGGERLASTLQAPHSLESNGAAQYSKPHRWSKPIVKPEMYRKHTEARVGHARSVHDSLPQTLGR